MCNHDFPLSDCVRIVADDEEGNPTYFVWDMGDPESWGRAQWKPWSPEDETSTQP